MAEQRNGRLTAKQTFTIAILSAVLGSSGGNLFLSRVFPDSIRPDPFTGTQGDELRRRIELVERHVRQHPDIEIRALIADLREQIAEGRAERNQIMKNQDRIIERLDHLK